MHGWLDPAAWQIWLGSNFGLEVSRERLMAVALQAGVVAGAYALALAARGLTCRWTDALILRLDPRLRPSRIMAALRPLVIIGIWWGLVLVATRIAWIFGEGANVLRIAGSLLLAWIVIRASSGLVRDPFAARLVATVTWIIAALDILGLLDLTATALDTLALTVGAVRISLLTVVKGALLLGVLLWAATAAAHVVHVRVSRMSTLTPSVQVLIAKLLKIALVTVAIVVALNSVGIDLTAFAVFSGAIGLGLGFGLQKIVSNLVSGVILLVDKSIKPGDVIEIEKTFGWITSLGARYVSVRGRDGKEYLIPNEDLITHRVTNWSYSSRLVRLDIEFGVAYGTDLRRARAVAVEAAKRPKRVLAKPEPVCHVTGFGDSDIRLLLRFWIDDPTSGVTNVKGDVMLSLWEALRDEGIEIPSPQREVIIKRWPAELAAPERRAAE